PIAAVHVTDSLPPPVCTSHCFVPLSPPLSAIHSFFFNAPPTTDIYTLSLHDALPICSSAGERERPGRGAGEFAQCYEIALRRYQDRKSTRLNSSHGSISYAVFCLKKKNKTKSINTMNHDNK